MTAIMPDEVELGTARGRWVLFAAVLGTALVILDVSIVNVALPVLGRELGASLAGLQWTISGYTLTLAALILLGGALGDRFGRRRVFVVGVVWFAVASLLCGLAPNVELLIAARALQGIGGALLAPGSMAIIQAGFVPADRAKAVGAWSGLGGIAGALGPFVGGWLLSVNWRLVFLINVPVALLVVVVAVRHVPETSNPDARDRPFDTAGAALCAVGLAGITASLVWAGQSGVTTMTALNGLVGLALLAVFVLRERRTATPMLPLSLFRSARFSAANVVTFSVWGGMSGVLFLLMLHLQTVAGYSPLQAGTSLLPSTVLMLLLSEHAGSLAQRIGPRLPMTAGPLLSAVAVLLLSRIGPDVSYVAVILPAAVVFGIGLALTVAPLTATVLSTVDDRRAGTASGVNNAVARTAGLVSVAALPLVVGLSNEDYTSPTAFAPAFQAAMYVSAGVFAFGALVALIGIHGRPEHPEPATPQRRVHCALDGPPLEHVARPATPR